MEMEIAKQSNSGAPRDERSLINNIKSEMKGLTAAEMLKVYRYIKKLRGSAGLEKFDV